MNNKIVNIIILMAGIVLLILGFNEYGTFGSRAGRLLGAGPSNEVLFYFMQAQHAPSTVSCKC